MEEKSINNTCIHLFNKYLLITYYILDTFNWPYIYAN